MLDANKARADLENILKTKEYQVYYNEKKGLFETWWDKAKEWIAAQLEKLFPAIDSASSASGTILITIIVVIIILLALAAFFLIRNVRRNRLLRTQKPLHSMTEMHWTFQRHLDEAKRLEGLADYTVATRHLFLGLLLSFHDQGLLEARIWKTNWDYYDELRKVNQLTANQFYHLAHFFEEVTYGKRMLHKDEYLQFQTETIKVLSAKGEETIL